MASAAEPQQFSPFLQPGPSTQVDRLAILHLKRDLLVPTVLKSQDDEHEGYSEGKVTNTRFGSFPHSTLINVPWGSQVRASAVDTGTRGRKGWESASKKRKRSQLEGNGEHAAETSTKDIRKDQPSQKAAVEAATGFVHVLPPTPEIWTSSLPHRTQVVYIPDYSYVLHRLRVRPGTRLIEAGAGSGSFTHASARAVFNSHPTHNEPLPEECAHSLEPEGKVFSFEFHAPRAAKLIQELSSHGLSPFVQLTHQDVYQDGFVPPLTPPSTVKATAIFLDLPAPWIALKHLTRSNDSILNPEAAVHLCTFSPCIEQVQRTINTMRTLGWLEIEMVEIAAKRIEVRRERVGLQEEGLRGVNDSPSTVDEALTRLREIEGRTKGFHENTQGNGAQTSKQQRLKNIRDAQEGRKLYKEGRLITKAEPELKTHTSYLVFATLPRNWSEEDERKAREMWPDQVVFEEAKRTSNRQKKKANRTTNTAESAGLVNM